MVFCQWNHRHHFNWAGREAVSVPPPLSEIHYNGLGFRAHAPYSGGPGPPARSRNGSCVRLPALSVRPRAGAPDAVPRPTVTARGQGFVRPAVERRIKALPDGGQRPFSVAHTASTSFLLKGFLRSYYGLPCIPNMSSIRGNLASEVPGKFCGNVFSNGPASFIFWHPASHYSQKVFSDANKERIWEVDEVPKTRFAFCSKAAIVSH